jgi:bacterioferritin-associated ferredoxin
VADKIVVCRCEDVTLHEIEEAVKLGHDDLESVKRYTGFGTGFCQGKQCVALCARLVGELSLVMPTRPITPRPPLHPTKIGHLALLLEGEDER